MRYHHVLAHNMLFAVLLTALSTRWVGRRPLDLAKVFLCVCLHFVGDFWGSGPGWAIYPLAPFSWQPLMNPHGWAFNGWQSQLILAGCFAVTVAIARWWGRTPLESLLPTADLMFADLAALGLLTRCACGRRALYKCHVCRAEPLCQKDARFLPDGRVACGGCGAAQ